MIAENVRRMAAKALGLAALAWWPLMAAGQPATNQAAAHERPLELNIMTFNIRWANPGDGEDAWEKRRGMVAEVISDHAPDIVGLQEALRGQLDDLGKALPLYAEVGVGRDDGKTKGEYSAILYLKDRFEVGESGTFWFSDEPDKPGSKSWGNRITRICTWAVLTERSGGRSFAVYNLHLDHESQGSRVRSVEFLRSRLMEGPHGGLPAIVTGDFNAGEANSVVVKMKEPLAGERVRALLVDSFRAARPDEKDVGTFNGFGKSTPNEKIDYIFVPSDAKVLGAGIDRRSRDGRYPSDHFPVWARIVLPPLPSPPPPSP